MEKTYINIYIFKKWCKCGRLFLTLRECYLMATTPRGSLEPSYLFTLEINENGEPRTFKHELPKEPVKTYVNFYKRPQHDCITTGVGYPTLEGALNSVVGKKRYLFTKCFDEIGKEYPINE